MPYDKDPNEKKDYSIDWSRVLIDGDSIVSSEWTVTSGLVEEEAPSGAAPVLTDTRTTVWVSGGTSGVHYPVTNNVVTEGGREYEKSFVVQVVSTAPPFTGDGSDGGSGASIDHGPIGATLTINQAGTHELDLTTNATITVSTTGDVSLRVHGTGDVTVAGETFTVDGVAVILVITWPRGQDAYLAGAGSSTGGGDPSDTTPPTAGTLTATGGQSQITLSVAGAADETALHASPYSFSTNGGTTYGAWQSSASTVITDLAAGSYTCRHRVRDAVGNITVGATKSATVTEPAQSYAAVAQAMNPLISLDLDDAPGTTSPTQDGSSPITASMTGTVSFGSRAGIGGYATCADFTGTEKITLPSTVLGGAAACSVTVLCDYDDHPASTLWIFGKDSDKIRVISSSAKPNYQVEYDTAAAAIQYETELAEPFIIGMSYDGTTIRGYFNGVEVATAPHAGPVPSNSNTLDLGGSFNGGINGLKVWNRALTADEHAQLAAAALS